MRTTVNRPAITVAAVVAVSLLLLSGGAYRILAAHLGRAGDSVPLPRGTLAKRLPLRIGGWVGVDRPVEETIMEAADCDDGLSRTYSRPGQAIQLWIAYGVRARDLMPHRPEVCYPGSGWTLEDTQPVRLPLASGTELECRIYRFSRGGMTAGGMTVLNYYLVDGQYSPDVSLLRSKAALGSGSIRYVAQVQIVASSGTGFAPEAAADAVQAFAADAASAIRVIMPDAWEDQAVAPGQSRPLSPPASAQ